MKPKILFTHSFLFSLAIGTLFNPSIGFSQVSPKYNVLFIAVDDMNDRISFLGNSEVVAPNLQRLVARGMVFKRAYCQFPLCNPSRTSLLSGWRPDKTGISTNNVRPRSVMGPNVVFLPEYFKEYGYHIERYGKIMHNLFENDISWDYAEPPESRDPDDMTLPGNSATTPGGSWWIKNVADQTTDDGKEARNLVARMQQPQTQPFFYALGLHAHNPFTPGLTYWNLNGDPSVQDLLPVDKKGTITNLTGNGSEPIVIPATPPNDRADVPPIALTVQILKSDYEWKKTIHAYDGEVAQMDVQLGLILDEMDRQNLWSNTVVVFWGDHGQHLGEHEGTWLKNTLFEESLHTPLIVYVPGKPGGECSKLVELVDLYSTLTELCELPVPSGMEGSSFVKLLDNPNTEWKRAVFSQVKRGTLTARSVRTGQYHYNSWGANGEELYDHDTDPHEYINLAKNFQYASVLNDMRTILTEGWTKSTPPLQCTDPQTFYADNDGDSYGNSSNFVQACSKPQGFVTDNTDCNDGNADIHPGATEVCNGIDDNCDGQVDDGDICNIDNDLDGYTPAEGDCNDNNANINPSAVEVCGNSLDDNCNGQVDEGCGGTCTNATGLATTNITSKSVTFNWTASVNPTVWQIQYKKAVAGATWINIRPQGSARSANISSLTANQTYKWHIHAKCGTTWTTYSSLQSFKTLSALQSTFAEGVMAKEPSLLLYPNPSTGEITIAHKSLSSGKLLFKVYENTGKMVFTSNASAIRGDNAYHLNLSNLASGIYYLELDNSNEQKRIKFLIKK